MNHSVSREEYQAALDHGGAIHFPGRARFRLSGGDRVRYLNGQVTNDVSHIRTDTTMYACVTNHKGKMEGDVYISTENDDAFLIDAPAELRETLFQRLDRYIIADDAELTDITEDWTLVHVLGDSWQLPNNDARRSDRFGEIGRDCWVHADSEGPAEIPEIAPVIAKIIRIERKIPLWGAELSPDILPPEAGLEERAISFTKGCYIGQEVISRIRSVGRVNRTIQYIEMCDGESIGDGMPLVNDDGKEVGRITSAAWHPVIENWIGLGIIKRGASEIATRLKTTGPGDSENMLSSAVEVRNTPDHQPS